ncbi:MAG: hypothetical protein Q9225_004303 [Loekoesia sp. 1 TL-2023]
MPMLGKGERAISLKVLRLLGHFSQNPKCALHPLCPIACFQVIITLALPLDYAINHPFYTLAMASSYAQYDDALQAFHRWRQSSEAQTPGLGGDNLNTVNFIPRSKLEDYLKRDHYVENLLDAVLDDHHRPSVGAAYVREYYLTSFANLLCIGEGHLIYHFQQYRSLRDDKLPYEIKPNPFPHTDDPEVFEKFKAAQWQFCAMSLQYDMKDRLGTQEILPIVSKEQIGEGGSAIIYKIVVHESYNSLRAPKESISHLAKTEQKSRQLHTNAFVLKTYRGKEAEENHKAERDAYMKLRWAGRPSPNIIAFYGWFTQGNSHNLILEYADQGTLESFMKRTVAPSHVEDVLLFWERLTSVMHGIQSIHGKIGNLRSASQILNGLETWDSLISNQAFLVQKIPRIWTPSGLGHTVPVPTYIGSFNSIDEGLGAPETYRSHVDSDSVPIQVTPAVDIWSVGCVFSEASAWAVFGWKKVKEYRRRRRREIETKTQGEVEGEEIFHWDGKLLDAVNDIHQQLKNTNQASHWITRNLLESVIGDMLQPGARPSAVFVFEKTKRLIRERASSFGVPLPKSNCSANAELADYNDNRINLTSLPQAPLGNSTNSSISLTPRPIHPHTNDASVSQDLARGSIPYTEDTPPSPSSCATSSLGPDNASYRYADREATSGNKQGRSIDTTSLISSKQRQPYVAPDSSHNTFKAAQIHEDASHLQSQEVLQRPTLSITQGLDWKKKKKSGINSVLPGCENLAYLNGRDHVGHAFPKGAPLLTAIDLFDRQLSDDEATYAKH